MDEAIYFPLEKLPIVIKVIRDGLKTCKDRETKKQLERQCEEFMRYWDDCQRED